MTTTETAAEILDRVGRDLAGPRREDAVRFGRRVQELDAHQARWATALKGSRLDNRREQNAVITVNQSSVGDKRLKLAVSVHGVQCAERCLDEDGGDTLKWKAPKTYGWTAEGPGDWGDRDTGRELARRAGDVLKSPRNKEMMVQLMLIDLLRSEPRETSALKGHRPVLYCGRFPIQLALPVTPRGSSESTSDGHLDLLVRRKARKVLSVFEIKRPGAGDAVESLAQAVEYAAALWHLTRDPEVRRAVWSLAGSGQTEQPRFEAVAVVEEGHEHELQAAATRLGALADISLRALLYSVTPNAMQLRWIDVTAEEEPRQAAETTREMMRP